MAGVTGGPHNSDLLSPGQSIFFLGDHTSPDAHGYVALMREVVDRFRPELGLRLITAGSRGQSASGLRSPELIQLLASAHPDWVVVGIGLADAMREPVTRRLLEDYRRAEGDVAQSALDATFGSALGAPSGDTIPVAEPSLANIAAFSADLRSAVRQLHDAGVSVCLLTAIIVGNSTDHPVNRVIHAYNDAIRGTAQDTKALLVDVEAAFREVVDRAAKYNKTVALTGPGGELNAQGQALVARSLLAALGLLPSGRIRGR